MNRRIRTRSTAVDGYLRYLKPGALAQLRDRKINARTHYISSTYQISLSLSPSRSPNGVSSSPQHDSAASNAVIDGEPPCFSPRFYGPRCPQRKKLMAVRSIVFSEPLDGSGSVVDGFANASANDFLVAH